MIHIFQYLHNTHVLLFSEIFNLFPILHEFARERRQCPTARLRSVLAALFPPFLCCCRGSCEGASRTRACALSETRSRRNFPSGWRARQPHASVHAHGRHKLETVLRRGASTPHHPGAGLQTVAAFSRGKPSLRATVVATSSAELHLQHAHGSRPLTAHARSRLRARPAIGAAWK